MSEILFLSWPVRAQKKETDHKFRVIFSFAIALSSSFLNLFALSAVFLTKISCTVMHKYPQICPEITLANVSSSSYYAQQIDREEKLHDSIQRWRQG